MAKPVGGRGKTAPYKTMQMRVPVPVKPLLENIVERFRSGETLSLNLNTSLEDTVSIKSNTSLEDDVQDFDDDDDDDFYNDDSEPTNAEVIKTQVKNLQSLKADVRLLERELAEVKEARSQLDQELNELHARNGDLNLEITNLQEKLAEVEREGSEVEQLRARLEITQALEKDSTEQLVQCHRDGFKAAEILKAAKKLPANAGGKIKKEIDKALELIDDV
jgi:prefoldin subunit 5